MSEIFSNGPQGSNSAAEQVAASVHTPTNGMAQANGHRADISGIDVDTAPVEKKHGVEKGTTSMSEDSQAHIHDEDQHIETTSVYRPTLPHFAKTRAMQKLLQEKTQKERDDFASQQERERQHEMSVYDAWVNEEG
jgi:hypothetical protein